MISTIEQYIIIEFTRNIIPRLSNKGRNKCNQQHLLRSDQPYAYSQYQGKNQYNIGNKITHRYDIEVLTPHK